MAGYLSEAEHRQVSDAVAAAEANTAGEIVTVVAGRSDGYSDVALAWAAIVAFTAIAFLALFPDFYLGLVDRMTGDWNAEWTPRGIFSLALAVGIIKFGAMWLLQLWKPLRFLLIPGPIKSARVRGRAVAVFKAAAERRTHGRTGILIYLSLAEHRAEILADKAIADQVEPEVWGEAMAALVDEVKAGRPGAGMAKAVEQVGIVLARILPPTLGDTNQIPDRLIEL